MGFKYESAQLSGKVRIVGEKSTGGRDGGSYVKLSISNRTLTIPRGKERTIFLDELLDDCKENGNVNFIGEMTTQYFRTHFSIHFWNWRPISREYKGSVSTSSTNYNISYSERLGDEEESYAQVFEIGKKKE